GFLLRVSAGVDLATHTATWLIQAIDPLTGEVIQDPTKGQLPPNNAQGQGSGFVTWTILPDAGAAAGSHISAKARVLVNNTAPPSTPPLFTLAEQRVPAAPPGTKKAEFTSVLQPFSAGSFATGFPTSAAGIGPMALAQAPDGTILVSGGAFRNQLYRFNPTT